MKTAIVCEGGGMRGVFTAGVLQAFMQGGFVADEFVGVSAGASNGASYVSGQMGRGYRTNVDYCKDPRYVGFKSYLKTGSFFGMDFIFEELAGKIDPFDYKAFCNSPTQFFAGATNIETGKTRYFGKKDILPGFYALRASCSLPLFSPIVEFGGGKYLDGGITSPIPIEKAIKDGCELLVVILTRPPGYRKKPQSLLPVLRQVYRGYPALLNAMQIRHLRYNHTLEKLRRMQEKGGAIVVAPPQPLQVDRFGKDKEKLICAYNIGESCGKEALTKIYHCNK